MSPREQRARFRRDYRRLTPRQQKRFRAAARLLDEGSGVNTFQSGGHNLLSTFFLCQGFDQPGDFKSKDPEIGPLANHGGPTQTVPQLKGSPAIGKAKRATAPPRDQRGRKRDRRPDIGAFER